MISHAVMDIGLLDGFTVAVDQRILSHTFKVGVPRCELEIRRFSHVRVIKR